MKNLMHKMDWSILRTKQAVKHFLTEDRGDTNFISIAIILVVVIVLAAVFISIGNRLEPKLTQAEIDLFDALK